MLYRILAVLALAVAYVNSEEVFTAEKHTVSFHNKSVPVERSQGTH
jgi:hypothetical protein